MKKFLLIFVVLVIVLPATIFATEDSLYQINQKVSDRLEEDTSRMAAIMEELKRRKGILETRVAYGEVDTQIKTADYWITSAAEAIAYQRAQKHSSKTQLKGSLGVLRNKILKAKAEVRKALDE